jgi:hypothetical protein
MKGVSIMLRKLKLTAGQWLNNSNARIILILGTLLIAVLIGGAPNDGGV